MFSGFALIGVAFWVFLAVAAVAGIIAEYKKRQLELEPLRAAIERGQQLDPAIIERLMARERHNSEINPQHLLLAGIIVTATGIGLGLLSGFVAQIAIQAFYAVLGVGVLVLCVGIGLLLASRAVGRYQASTRGHGTQVARGSGV